MQCEMCGKTVQKTERVMVDGVVLQVCDSCSKFGKKLDVKKVDQTVRYKVPVQHSSLRNDIKTQNKTQKRKPLNNPDRELENLEVVPEYPELIRSARDRLSWTQEELAAKLLEKKNVIAKLERGEFMPSLKLARKIEKLLDIKLIETI